MNQPTTASPPSTTVDLIDQFNQTEWREADNWEGPTEAGLELKAYVEQLEHVPPEKYQQQLQQVRLLSILWPELKAWIETWDLGLCFAAVYQEAKQRIYAHVAQPTSAQADWLEVLLMEEGQQLPRSAQTVRPQVVAMLSSMLTQADREALAKVAAQEMRNGVEAIARLSQSD